MPINTHSRYEDSGGIRVETMTHNGPVDNDAFVANKAHEEHSAVDCSVPWSQSYRPDTPEEPLYVDDISDVEIDPDILQANRNDLRIRNLHPLAND